MQKQNQTISNKSLPKYNKNLLITITGNGDCGKTSILNRLLSDSYDNHCPVTMGQCFYNYQIELPEFNKSINTQIIDTNGHIRTLTALVLSYKISNGIMFVIDVQRLLPYLKDINLEEPLSSRKQEFNDNKKLEEMLQNDILKVYISKIEQCRHNQNIFVYSFILSKIDTLQKILNDKQIEKKNKQEMGEDRQQIGEDRLQEDQLNKEIQIKMNEQKRQLNLLSKERNQQNKQQCINTKKQEIAQNNKQDIIEVNNQERLQKNKRKIIDMIQRTIRKVLFKLQSYQQDIINNHQINNHNQNNQSNHNSNHHSDTVNHTNQTNYFSINFNHYHNQNQKDKQNSQINHLPNQYKYNNLNQINIPISQCTILFQSCSSKSQYQSQIQSIFKRIIYFIYVHKQIQYLVQHYYITSLTQIQSKINSNESLGSNFLSKLIQLLNNNISNNYNKLNTSKQLNQNNRISLNYKSSLPNPYIKKSCCRS